MTWGRQIDTDSKARLVAAPNAPSAVKHPESPKLREVLGPGLITGASDDDPSGIATYSQAGAQFGYSLSWIMLFTWPLMCAIQMISARIGRVTGRGIAGNLVRHYPAPVIYIVVLLLVAANIINLGADLGAMAAALKLLIGGPQLLYVGLFGVVSLLLEVFLRYSRYVTVLKWLTVSLFAYVGVAVVSHIPWGSVARSFVVPTLSSDPKYLTMIVALLGTTISPYLFFWQSEQEVEETKENVGARPLVRAPAQARAQLRRIRIDTLVGMGLSNLVALSIILTTAATLHAHNVSDIQTSAQAAEALKPIAGEYAFLVFALGIIGTGLLALPVLAGSAAYALGETFGWHVGLTRTPSRAKPFYMAITAATVLGGAMNIVELDPIKALFWSAVINGVVAVPVMIAMMLLSSNREAMGEFKLPFVLKLIGWLSTGVMAAAGLGMLVTWNA